MKAYIIISGAIFAVITVLHIARLVTEPMNILREPIFVALTILGAVLAVWAFTLLRRVKAT